MSDDEARHSPEPQESSRRPSRSPAEKVIWCIIVIVICGLGLELYAKTSFEKSMTVMDDTFNGIHPEPQHLSDVRKLLSGLTLFGEPADSEEVAGQQEIRVSWLSPSFKYQVTLVTERGGDDPVVEWYKLGDGNWARPLDAPSEGEELEDVSAMPSPGGGVEGGADEDASGDGGDSTTGSEGSAARSGTGRRPGSGRAFRGLLGILNEEAVIAEISLTVEQSESLVDLADTLQVDFGALRDVPPEEREAILEKARLDTETAVSKVLDRAQLDRLRQIDLQRTGLTAVGRPDVAVHLNLTDEQSASLDEIMAAYRSGRRAAMEERNFGAFGEIRSQAEGKIRALLTEDQLEQWQELLGPPGPPAPERRGFGSGGRGGRGGGQNAPGGDGGRSQRPASDDAEDQARQPAASEE